MDTIIVGIFDSGVGGLSILRTMEQLLPSVQFIYFGDTIHIPYGTKTTMEIQKFSTAICEFLIDLKVDVIVVACNTATQAAIKVLRHSYKIPFIGIEPAVKPAASRTKTGHIGIATTEQTAHSSSLQQLIAAHASTLHITIAACPDLVTLAESGMFSGDEVLKRVQQSLQPFLEQSIDVLVLGCTHFPLLKQAVQQVMGSNVLVLENSEALSRQLRLTLEQTYNYPAIQHYAERTTETTFYCTGDTLQFAKTAGIILERNVSCTKVEVAENHTFSTVHTNK